MKKSGAQKASWKCHGLDVLPNKHQQMQATTCQPYSIQLVKSQETYLTWRVISKDSLRMHCIFLWDGYAGTRGFHETGDTVSTSAARWKCYISLADQS